MQVDTRNKISKSLIAAYRLGKRKAFNPNPSIKCPNIEKLIYLYNEKKLGSWSIAKEFNVSQHLIMIWLKDNGIKTRSKSEASSITKNGYKDGELNKNWKGDKVGYQALHAWVRKHKGTPQSCEFCKTTGHRKYEWANKDHKYKRNLDDWIRLCTSCHRKYDKSNNLKG